MENVLPFWQKFAFDSLYGGVFEAVDENGEVISTDKPVVTQALAARAFAYAYNSLTPNDTWLLMAKDVVKFLMENGRDAKGNWYAELDRRGTSVSDAVDFSPALWVVLALAQLFKATGESEYVTQAQKTLIQTLKKRDAQLKRQLETSGRVFKSLDEFVLIGHILLEAESFTDRKWYKRTLDSFLQELANDFYDKRTEILLENVTPEGHFCDCPQGRLLVPGRVFEMAGIALEFADRTRNRRLLNQMLDLTELTAKAAWDETNGGFYWLMDVKSLPPLDARWNHKLAWVHLEALQTFLKAHLLSARPVFLDTFEKTSEYLLTHFPDPVHGEWFGELSRENSPVYRHKITAEKSCESTVRNLVNTLKLLSLAAEISPATDKKQRSQKRSPLS